MLSEGDIHKRESLANTLRILSEEGSDAFYKGKLGRQIIDELQKLGSKMSMEDLMEYKYVHLLHIFHNRNKPETFMTCINIDQQWLKKYRYKM